MTLSLTPAAAQDGEALAALRVEAMRDSLERIGRFDPGRARQRFLGGFEPASTRHVNWEGHRAGFVVVRQMAGHLLLDHLYIAPAWQGRGIGSAVLAQVQQEARSQAACLRVGALRESASNRFYLRHGFTQCGQAEWDIYYEWRAPQ